MYNIVKLSKLYSEYYKYDKKVHQGNSKTPE